MFATLKDKSGNQVKVELLNLDERNLNREAMVLRTFDLESPLPVATPGTYLLELQDGSFVETEIVFCRQLPSGKFFQTGLRLVDARAAAH